VSRDCNAPPLPAAWNSTTWWRTAYQALIEEYSMSRPVALAISATASAKVSKRVPVSS